MSDAAAADRTGSDPALTHGVSFRQAFWVWLKVAGLSFGGPAGQIAVMHRIIVEEKRWVSESRFLHALNYCMLLPGPEAQQLATYIGWLMHRTPGGIMAGGLFIVPGVLAIMALSYVYALLGNIGIVAALFFGLKAAVLAIVLQAVFRVGSRALKNRNLQLLAGIAFVAIFFMDVPFPIIVLASGIIGYLATRFGSTAFKMGGHGAAKEGREDSLLGEAMPEHARLSVAGSLRVGSVWLLLWLAPVALLLVFLGQTHVFSQIAVFFSKMAMVTFGGAYAALAYVAQQAVDHYHWLKPKEMLDGAGMAETTPGPLIMVLQFVGFMAAFREPGSLSPVVAGTLGGLLATWVTFTPCFLWIFLRAPFIEAMRDNKALAGALSAITAAVVGVILNLAIWFAIHALFGETHHLSGFGFSFDVPVLSSVDPWALVLAVIAGFAIFRFKAGMLQTLAATSAAGLLLHAGGLLHFLMELRWELERPAAKVMRRLFRTAATVALLVALPLPSFAGSPAQEGFRKLLAHQIRQALVGREFGDDVHFHHRYGADGEIAGQEMGRKINERWRIANDQFCMTSRNRENCYFVWKKGDAVRLTLDDPDISVDGRVR